MPIACFAQSILLAKIPQKRHTSLARVAVIGKRKGNSRSRGVGRGEQNEFPVRMDIPRGERRGGEGGGNKAAKEGIEGENDRIPSCRLYI